MYKKLFLLNLIKLMSKDGDAGGGNPSDDDKDSDKDKKDKKSNTTGEKTTEELLAEVNKSLASLTAGMDELKKKNESLEKELSETKKLSQELKDEYTKSFNGDDDKKSPDKKASVNKESDTFDIFDAIAKTHR